MKQTGLFKNSKQINKQLINKMTAPKKSRKTVVSGQRTNAQLNAIANKVAVATDATKESMQVMRDQQAGYTFELVTDPQELDRYVSTALGNGIISIDTEGSGLDPIDDFTCGMSLYTPGESAIYVPYKHTDYQLNVKPGQMDIESVQYQLQRISEASKEYLKVIYGNAKYDIRIKKNTLNHIVEVYWDVILAGSFLNENEPHGLKYMWDKYIWRNEVPANLKTYDKLFDKLGFNWFDWNIVYPYAANDALMTYQLYEFQKEFLHPEGAHTSSQDLLEASKLFTEIEVPLINELVMMEETGVTIDKQKAENLENEYSARLEKVTKQADEIISKFDLSTLPQALRGKLSNPINIGSPDQVAIILYDLLKLEQINKRGTGEAVIEQLQEKYPEHKSFLSKILEYRGLKKLLSTYIIKLPKIVKEKTGKLHGQFNQYGAKTGRFSSKDPNLQNIPARNKDIRPIFTASEGYYLVSGDYSQQEPRVLAHLSGDESMINAYAEGRDLYAWVASVVYAEPYDQCLEFHPDTGETQKEGAYRRQSMKSVVLGLMYGRGANAIAEQIGSSKQEAQRIVDMFYNSFPKVRQYIDQEIAFCKRTGYVKTAYGRKRRLPDLNLPKYEITDKNTKQTITDNLVVQHIYQEMDNAWGSKQKNKVKKYWSGQGVHIKDNGGFISEAERQVINSEVQGTSADITKKAMLELSKDERLKQLGFRMILTVHDEVIGEAPKENALQAKEVMSQVMIDACADVIKVPMKVDTEITEYWYGEDITDKLQA